MSARSDIQMAGRAAGGRAHWWGAALAWIGAAMDRAEQRARLASLDDGQLCDLGLTRSQAMAEARRPWWRA